MGQGREQGSGREPPEGKRLTFRLSPAEYTDLASLADRAGLTLGSYVRSRALAMPTTRAVRRPTIQVHALNRLQADLSRIGNNLNQIARRVNAGDTPLLSELANSLASFREATHRVCDALDCNT